MSCAVQIRNAQRKIKLTPHLRDLIQAAAEAALRAEGIEIPCELSVLLVSDKKIRELNRDFRNIDRATDVLSFPSGDLCAPGAAAPSGAADGLAEAVPAGRPPGGPQAAPGDGDEPVFLGDMALSLERARAQAEAYGHGLDREVAFLVAHSVLHCLGYDHETGPREESVMFRKQEDILRGMGLTR